MCHHRVIFKILNLDGGESYYTHYTLVNRRIFESDLYLNHSFSFIVLFFLGRRIVFFHFKLYNFLGFFFYHILKFLKKHVKMFVNLFSILHSIHVMFNASSKFLRGSWMRRMNPKSNSRRGHWHLPLKFTWSQVSGTYKFNNRCSIMSKLRVFNCCLI